MDIPKYVKDKVEKHPNLQLVEQTDTHANVDGHVFIIGRVNDKLNSAALSTSGLEEKANKDDAVLKSLIDNRFDQVLKVLGAA